MQVGSTSALVPNVLGGQLNAAVVHLPVDDAEVIITPLFAEDLVLLAHADHPLAKHDEISLADLHEVPLLLPPMGAALRKVLERAAATVDITLRAQAEIDGARLLASLAFDGYGAAIVPATAIPAGSDVEHRRITVPELPRRVVAFIRRRRPSASAPTMAAFDTLRSLIEEYGDTQPGVHTSTGAFALPKND